MCELMGAELIAIQACKEPQDGCPLGAAFWLGELLFTLQSLTLMSPLP